jgi:hypothetical protein
VAKERKKSGRMEEFGRTGKGLNLIIENNIIAGAMRKTA